VPQAFLQFLELRAARAFTSRSLRTLNCPSNLIDHIRLNKPANGVGGLQAF
jgi:hypothetical protein